MILRLTELSVISHCVERTRLLPLSSTAVVWSFLGSSLSVCHDTKAEQNARLARENARLARDLVQSQSELEEVRRRLESSKSSTTSSQPSSEGRLRMLMTDQTATVAQMTEAVCATEAVIAEMRREIAGKRLREKACCIRGALQRN